jgi:hypothetical protein
MSGTFQEGESWMHVNRGIGSKTLPFRLFASPEVTLLKFRPSRPSRSGSGESALPTEPLWLSDFESELELSERWRPSDVTAVRSPELAAHGRFSARLTFENGVTPKFAMDHFLRRAPDRTDWSGYGTLRLWLFNPQGSSERLILQLKDGAGRLYKQGITLAGSSQQEVSIRLKDVKPSVDLRRIVQLNLFRWRPPGAATFYLDAVRLEPRSPRKEVSHGG